MTPTPAMVFLFDALLATLICGGIAFYLKKHLRLPLIELCGTSQRASFWLALCNVTLVVVPLIFVLGYVPDFESSKNLIFEIAGQIKSALIGIVLTLGGFALVLLKYISRENPKPAPGPAR